MEGLKETLPLEVPIVTQNETGPAMFAKTNMMDDVRSNVAGDEEEALFPWLRLFLARTQENTKQSIPC